MSLWMKVKKKLPATFNAAEYETERLLREIRLFSDVILQRQDELEKRLMQLEGHHEERLDAANEQLKQMELLFQQGWERMKVESAEAMREQHLAMEKGFAELSASVAERSAMEKGFTDLSASAEELSAQVEMAVEKVSALSERLSKTHLEESKMLRQFQEMLERALEETRIEVRNGGIYTVSSCRSDEEFDQKLVPLNHFFKGKGMAVSMHLTSVAEALDDIVYQTADLTRTSALSLAVDEIKRRQLPGETAELGVAAGKFAAVINALLPEKKLYLFDTFEGFPDADLEFDRAQQYSNQRPGSYSGIDLNQVMGKMHAPENCILRKGWFPDTAEGLEEQFCFVSIDCDLFKPIYAGLNWFYPRMVKHGYLFVHDYRSKYFLGVKEALARFADEQGISYMVLPDNTGTAVIIKQ
ncbi:MAG: hypothetical protein HFH26_03430 [Clostridiaceae bacterium]|nr:hypothetical protein [Clostridiaceae bacterium]